MSKISNWKVKAKIECKNKNLYNLTKVEKKEICQKVFERLNKISINKKKADIILKTIRGVEM